LLFSGAAHPRSLGAEAAGYELWCVGVSRHTSFSPFSLNVPFQAWRPVSLTQWPTCRFGFTPLAPQPTMVQTRDNDGIP
ncbi:hypothetical protein NPS74_24685, partial [Cutibacterium acnes subsp. acnes]|nr:hypothetical protein [Cutibacterium acnes subsp. acnes]